MIRLLLFLRSELGMLPYPNLETALDDVLRLFKRHDLQGSYLQPQEQGGGKAVIIGDSRTEKSKELFWAFGRCVDFLGGQYITAEDVGG